MNSLTQIGQINLPLPQGEFIATLWQTKYADQPEMKYALLLATRKMPTIPVIRVQSACLLGETFNTYQCDCGEQLDAALEIIQQAGGILFYLDQEGRSHGLFTKFKELEKQQQLGMDTVEASNALGRSADERSFTVVADLLKQMNINQVKLLTNNPRKLSALTDAGIKITRLPLEIEPNQHNHSYLTTKKHKLGHLLSRFIRD